MVRAAQYGQRRPKVPKTDEQRRASPGNIALKDGDKDYTMPCKVCGRGPTVYPTRLCGPCCFGDAKTAGGKW